MSPEPESLILRLLRDMRAEIGSVRSDVASLRGEMATKGEIAELRADFRSDLNSLRANVAADFNSLRKEVGEQIVGLREQHLNLPALGAH
jgi:hypothetical protein